MSVRDTTWHVQADDDWDQVAPRDPEEILAVDPRDVFHAKQGRSIARWKLDDRLAVYLKRHYQESRWRGWLATITRRPNWSAAWQEYRRLRNAAGEGFVVPRAVAVGVGVGPKGRLRGYLAVEELYGMKALHELIPMAAAQLSPTQFTRWKRGLVAELARVSKSLHDRRYFHKDLYLCHFFASVQSIHAPPQSWNGQLAMIDLHRLDRHPITWRWWQLKDLAQLVYSTHDVEITARDRLRFWKLYAGPERKGVIGRLIRKLIMVRWRNYQEHNTARRAA